VASLADIDVAVSTGSPDDLADADLGIVVDVAGSGPFSRATRVARESGTPWLAVELGGVGGYPVVDAAVTGFAPGTACYECLGTRVGSNVDPEQEPAAAPEPPVSRVAGAIAGRAAATVLSGADGPFGQIRELPHARRRLLPVPGCRCRHPTERSLERTTVDRDVETALAHAEQALDERVGIVREVGEAESFPAPYYLAQTCDTTGFSDAQAGQQAAGVSDDWNEALMKALGEALERYAAGVYRTDSFRASENVENAVEPSAFVRPEWGAPDGPVEWIEGTDLRTDGDVLLPAELAVYPPFERSIRPAITTGLGLGSGTVGALLSGLYEVVERDATVLSWYSTFEPLELTVDDDRFDALAARARSESLSVTPLLLTQDVDVPVVAVAVHRTGAWPRFALGTAADLDPNAAARSALAEAVQNWIELRGMGEDGAADASGAIGEYAAFPDSARSFIDAAGTVPAGEVGPDAIPSGEDELDAVVDRCADADLDVYAASLTTPDIDEIGFEAVRVLSPGAQPLFFGESYFGERAESVPESLGFEPRLDRDHHPFP
jgi:ribosomal protein S12 methylthiotransferase accessory factor